MLHIVLAAAARAAAVTSHCRIVVARSLEPARARVRALVRARAPACGPQRAKTRPASARVVVPVRATALARTAPWLG